MDARSENRLRSAANRIIAPLEKLVNVMAVLEPGNVVTDAEFQKTATGMRVAYKSRPISVQFIDAGRRITVRVEPAADPPQDA